MTRTLSLWLLAGGASYLLGAVPFGLLVARARGVDIRRVGSGNIGATNVFRSVGRSWGVLTFLLDMGKGFAAVRALPWAAALALGTPPDAAVREGLTLVCACLAVAGHNWPVYLGFRGGKGVATSAGVLLGLAWLACLAGLAVWLVTLLLTRYVSVASMAAAVGIGLAAWPLYGRTAGPWLPLALTLLAAATVLRHRSNVRRLLDGTEHRFSFGRR
jgi:glycerol-3-phosphate acyltransferase PlsY